MWLGTDVSDLGRSVCLHLQDRIVSPALTQRNAGYTYRADSFVAMVAVYQTARRHSQGLDCLKSVAVVSVVL